MTPDQVLEAIAAALAAGGALLLALNIRISNWAWPTMTVGSLLSAWMMQDGGYSFLSMRDLAFTAINFVGLWRWCVAPWLCSLGVWRGT